jgi:hypothetical protein
MRKLQFIFSFLVLVLIAFFVTSCGAGSSQSKLQSIALSPAAANADEVQFTATGYYIHPSSTLTPQPATWGACYQGATTSGVSVTSGGKAQCATGASGTYTVYAFDPTNCTVLTACGGGCTVVGTAQLTCP